MLLGRCHAEAQINLGSDGNITFNMALPRSLLFAGEDYEYNLAGDGRIEGFNLFKLLNQKSTSSQSPLKLKGATAEGAYKFSLIGKGLPIPVIEFDGNIYKVMLEVNVMKQKKYEEISLPLAFKIERNKINFTKPVEVKLLGSTLKYTGALGFEQHLSWQGALQISSAGRFSRMVPGLFNCKSKPTNPLSFKISGLVGAPMCR